jgi:hypothetical protein
VYAFGIIMWEAFSGQVAFQGERSLLKFKQITV